MTWIIASVYVLGYAYLFYLLTKWGKKTNEDFNKWDIMAIALLSFLSWYGVYKYATEEEV